MCAHSPTHTHTLTNTQSLSHQPPPLPNTGGYCLQRGALLAASQLGSVTGLVPLQSTGCAGPPWQTKRSLHKQLLTVSSPSGLDYEDFQAWLEHLCSGPNSRVDVKTMSFNMCECKSATHNRERACYLLKIIIHLHAKSHFNNGPTVEFLQL